MHRFEDSGWEGRKFSDLQEIIGCCILIDRVRGLFVGITSYSSRLKEQEVGKCN